MKKEDIGKLICMVNNGIHRSMVNSEEFRKIQGMTGKNGWLIGFLAKNQGRPVYQRDLEKEFNVTRSTASKVISLMEKKGFVTRRGVEGDARLKEILLTEKAYEVVERIERSNTEMEKQLFQGFTQEEWEQLGGYLLRLLENLEQCETVGAPLETTGLRWLHVRPDTRCIACRQSLRQIQRSAGVRNNGNRKGRQIS
ncbi:MAG: MarR family transcriptional regulator [Firmicutes bacterium]|jgi:DNA-binding MarR family transcriptional regulator|nr:MarR family transcriptional regulator [Bacillota bacterium]